MLEVFNNFVVWRATLLIETDIYLFHQLNLTATTNIFIYTPVRFTKRQYPPREEKNGICEMVGNMKRGCQFQKAQSKTQSPKRISILDSRIGRHHVLER